MEICAGAVAFHPGAERAVLAQIGGAVEDDFGAAPSVGLGGAIGGRGLEQAVAGMQVEVEAFSMARGTAERPAARGVQAQGFGGIEQGDVGRVAEPGHLRQGIDIHA